MHLLRKVGFVSVAFFCLIVDGFSVPEPVMPKLPKSFLRVPMIRQETNYSCGAAVLVGILRYWRAYQGDEGSLYERLSTTPENGTKPDKIVEVAKQFGLKVKMQKNLNLSNLKKALEKGETVILNLQAWRDSKKPKIPWHDNWNDGHYVVLVGMDQHYAYAMDPSIHQEYAYLPLEELLERWHDFEDRGGTIVRYHHLGICIRGRRPLKNLPISLTKME